MSVSGHIPTPAETLSRKPEAYEIHWRALSVVPVRGSTRQTEPRVDLCQESSEQAIH